MNTTTNTENEPTITWVIEAKFKDLTDEEIMQIVEESYMPQGMDKSRYTMFARAILRKAQEK